MEVNLLITPSPTNQFIYKSAWLWNEFRKAGPINFTSTCSSVKNLLQQSLLKAQSRYRTDWCDKNFTESLSQSTELIISRTAGCMNGAHHLDLHYFVVAGRDLHRLFRHRMASACPSKTRLWILLLIIYYITDDLFIDILQSPKRSTNIN